MIEQDHRFLGHSSVSDYLASEEGYRCLEDNGQRIEQFISELLRAANQHIPPAEQAKFKQSQSRPFGIFQATAIGATYQLPMADLYALALDFELDSYPESLPVLAQIMTPHQFGGLLGTHNHTNAQTEDQGAFHFDKKLIQYAGEPINHNAVLHEDAIARYLDAVQAKYLAPSLAPDAMHGSIPLRDISPLGEMLVFMAEQTKQEGIDVAVLEQRVAMLELQIQQCKQLISKQGLEVSAELKAVFAQESPYRERLAELLDQTQLPVLGAVASCITSAEHAAMRAAFTNARKEFNAEAANPPGPRPTLP